MFISARRQIGTRQRSLGANWCDALPQPFGWICRSQGDSTGDARVRAAGEDPNNGNKPIAPQYAGAITVSMLKYGIDPTSPDAYTKLAAALRAEEGAQQQHDYNQFMQDQNKPWTWPEMALWGGLGLLGIAVFVKIAA
jgi:hypothetical protein